MKSQEKGAQFERITKNFFVWLFEKIGFTIQKDRIQFSGNQHGFDILLILEKNYITHRVIIECKNYSSDLAIGNILKKAWDFEKNYSPTANDLFIAINPNSNFKNEDNSEKSSPIIEEKFDFKYYQLDESNGVKELFALNIDFYKEIYNKDPDFVIDEKKAISKLESHIFSRKPFKKVVLNERDKSSFIVNNKINEYAVERYFSDEVEDITTYFGQKAKFSLQEILKKEDKIFILGNPGSGKSTELYKIANELWVIGEQVSLTPIFIRLKDFTTLNTIESFLPKRFDDLKSVVLVLDGIDEIKDIEDFKSKLAQFISANQKNEELGKVYKYIISCRTNIYESIVHKITNFKTYYILDIPYEQAINFLKNECGDIVDNIEFSEFSLFLKNPFQIILLASFINENKALPKCTSDMWETYISKRLKVDKEDKLKNFDPTFIKAKSKQVSLVNELTQESTISEDNLFVCCGNSKSEFEEFKKNPLIDKIINSSRWGFEHKNVQEYFAALTLCSLNVGSIIEFIQIENSGKTHPSLFNTISFLLNLISEDPSKHNILVDWFVKNEPEILFRSDGNRISNDIREKVFQIYFQRVCIEKTLWLTTNKTFSVSEIIKFSNCPGNSKYLMGIVQENFHTRAIISAVSFLGNFSIPGEDIENLKRIFLKLLGSNNIDTEIKSEIIRALSSLGLYESDSILLTNTFKLFANEKSKKINYSLLYILSKRKEVDSFVEYLLKEFKRVLKIEPRNDNDNVGRGNRSIIQGLIISLKSADNFLEFLRYYLQNQYQLNYDSDFEKKLISRCVHFIKIDNGFLLKIIDQVGEGIDHDNRDMLQTIIKESDLLNVATKHILSSIKFEKSRYFLAHIVNQETIDLLIDTVVKEQIVDKEIEGFRNYIGNSNNRELAVYFHEEMEKKGVKFSSPAFSSNNMSHLIQMIKEQIRDNFDILFKKEELIQRVKSFFIEHGDPIHINKLREIRYKWYDDNGHSNSIAEHIEIIDYLSRYFGDTLSYEAVEKIINQNTFLFKQIKRGIKRNENNNYKLEITNEQIQAIKDWIISASSEIDFNKIITLNSYNSFSYSRDYDKLSTILYLRSNFSIELPKDFLLNCLQYYKIDKFEIDDDFYSFKDLINDHTRFNKTIVDNLNNKSLFASIVRKHITYALDNKLADSYRSIRKYILQSDSALEYNTLKLYIENSKDYEILKECCYDYDSQLCWNAIDILIETNKEKVFCLNIAKKYLEDLGLTRRTFGFIYYCTSLLEKLKKNNKSPVELNGKIWISNAIGVYIKLNHIDGLDYFINYMNLSSNISSFSFNSFNYNNLKNYSRIEYLYNVAYLKSFDPFDSRSPRYFLDELLNSLSKQDVTYKKVQKRLHKIKRKTIKSGQDQFYINLLIEQSTNNYINSKSLPYTFDLALKKTNTLLSA